MGDNMPNCKREYKMKKLFYFVSFNTDESDIVCNKMARIKPNQEFPGFLGKIEFNNEECLNTIASTVNHFINSEKEEIYFGVDEKDFDELFLRINIDACKIKRIKTASCEAVFL